LFQKLEIWQRLSPVFLPGKAGGEASPLFHIGAMQAGENTEIKSKPKTNFWNNFGINATQSVTVPSATLTKDNKSLLKKKLTGY
jgi:hypothetical protein